MTIIDNNTVVVFTSDELKSALENNNGYTYIYFGSDITLEKGIKISNEKVNVTIDGTYEGNTYTFYGMKSLGSESTINVSYPSIINVIVRNMNIVWYNYYGVVFVPENSSYQNVCVEYNNITYSGTQLSYHPYGLTRIIGSNITIEDGSLVVGNEVAECNQIEIGGVTNINHYSKSNSSFWFRNANPSFKILSNSSVNFVSTYRELFYGVNNLSFSILNNASFFLTTHSGMAYGNNGTLNTIIASNAIFKLKQTSRNGSYATWYSYGSITLNDNSSLEIVNNYDDITTSGYNIYFSSNGSFILNNPKKLVLYNSKTNVIYSGSLIPFNFNFSRMNLFSNVIQIDSNISSSTLPEYSWYKEKENSSVVGTFSSSQVKITSHNFTEQEIEKLPSLDNFIFSNKRIFSVGDFPFMVNALTDSDTSMSGVTLENASVLITYNDKSSVVICDEKGNFSYSYDEALPIGTVITFNIKMYNDLIYHTKVITIVYSGELFIDSVSSSINFKLSPISLNPILCPREGELFVNVVDSRVSSTDWKLYASIKHEFMDILGNILNGSLVYKDELGNVVTLSDKPTLVYNGKKNSGNVENTSVTWNEDEGILLMINGKIISGLEYSTVILWSLEE